MKIHGKNRSKNKQASFEPATDDDLRSPSAVLALFLLAEKFPHRQFNSAELSALSGIGRTGMAQIKKADDTPFALGKCTLRRLDAWLEKHPGFKQAQSRA